MPTISMDDLQLASCAHGDEMEWLVHRQTGQLIVLADGSPDEEPEERDEWVELPSARDLDCGKGLYFQFAREHLPELESEIRVTMQRRGSYRRVKDLFAHHDLLDAWHAYADMHLTARLREWAQENGFTVA